MRQFNTICYYMDIAVIRASISIYLLPYRNVYSTFMCGILYIVYLPHMLSNVK